MVRQRQPQFLLMEHADRWDLPKGHAEGDETLLETALRETEEESGVPASLIEIDPVFQFVTEYRVEGKKRGSYDKRVTIFLGFLAEKPSITTSEHTGYRWWDWPPTKTIQARTIDPLLTALAEHLNAFPRQIQGPDNS